MNGKRAKRFRRAAEKALVGVRVEDVRGIYRAMKRLSKRDKAGVDSRPPKGGQVTPFGRRLIIARNVLLWSNIK